MSLVIPQSAQLAKKGKIDMPKGGENINKWLEPWSDGSKGGRCCKNTDPKRHRGPGQASTWQGLSPPPWRYPVPVGCRVGDVEGSIWLHFRHAEWTSLEKCTRGDSRLGWSHRKNADPICIWLKAGRESWKAGWHEILKDRAACNDGLKLTGSDFIGEKPRSCIQKIKWIQHCNCNDKGRR